jgi:hypothetical protein
MPHHNPHPLLQTWDRGFSFVFYTITTLPHSKCETEGFSGGLYSNTPLPCSNMSQRGFPLPQPPSLAPKARWMVCLCHLPPLLPQMQDRGGLFLLSLLTPSLMHDARERGFLLFPMLSLPHPNCETEGLSIYFVHWHPLPLHPTWDGGG